MLWFDKHRPRTFNDLHSHSETVEILKKYTLSDVPNLIFCGQSGHGRRTMLYATVSNLYGKYPEFKQRTSEVSVGSAQVEASYYESEEVVEINPSEYGTKDRVIVQTIIKDMAQTKPILSLLGSKKHVLRIVVISNAENLTRDAQEALRRTLEVYSGQLRLFMICKEITKIIEPIKSRFLLVRMRGYTTDEIKGICSNICEREAHCIPDHIIEGIAKNAAGNCKRAICLLEAFCERQQDETESLKRARSDLEQYKLEWERKIENLADIIRSGAGKDAFLKVRKAYYEILNLGIVPQIVLKHLARTLSQADPEVCRDIIEAALTYEERLNIGNKPLYHLEAFAARALLIYANRNL